MKTSSLILSLFIASFCSAQVRYDTLKVVMQCADTSFKTGVAAHIFRSVNYPAEDLPSVRNRIPDVFWIFGYQVNVLASGKRRVAGYLDEKKKPLSKNIVVWMAATAK